MAEIITEVAGKATKDLINVKASTKEELRARAEILAQIYNEEYQNGNLVPTIEVFSTEVEGTTGVQVRKYMEETVNEYTSIARNECFNALKATDNPMLEAVKQLSYPTIRIVDKQVGEDNEKISVTSIENTEKQIDLLKLHKYCGGIGKDPKWNGLIERMNFYMTARQAKRLLKKKEHLTSVLKEINDSYMMCEIARGIDMGKDPTSNTKMLDTLQSIVTAMIGEEYKATSHDVNYLCDLYASKGKKALSVNCANHRYFRGYIAAICHGIVTGEDYEVSFKKVNAK